MDRQGLQQMPKIREIFDREKWFLSEKLGYDCGEHHPDLQLKVASIILILGEQLRKACK